MSDISSCNMKDVLEDCLHEVQANAVNIEIPGLSSGFYLLDDLICGFEAGKVYVIGARPAMGRDTFMLSMIRDITLESKAPVMLFSTNHRKSDLIYRLLSIHCGINTTGLQRGWLEELEWDRLDKEAPTLVDAPLYIHDCLNLSINELEDTARQCIKEKGIKIIIIDCLQMIVFDKTDRNPSERIAKVMSALKQLAYETGIPVVVGSMMNRYVDQREGLYGKRPQLADLANSCYIEELADVIMMVYRPEYYQIFQDEEGRDLHGLMEIVVMKNAQRPLGSVFLDYKQETGELRLKEGPVKWASKRVGLKDFKTDNKAVESLIDTFDLKEVMPF